MAITSTSLIGSQFSVTAYLDDATVGLASIGKVMHLSTHALFAERYKVITADKNTIKGKMVDLGFDALSPDTIAVTAAFQGRVPITEIVLGRRSPADPTWDAAWTAIKTQLDIAKIVVVHALTPDRTGSVQRELAAAAMARSALFHFTTPDPDVRDNEPDAFTRDIITDGSVCVMTYYDPAGQSGAAAPSVTTLPETYVLTGKDESAKVVTLAMSVLSDAGVSSPASFTVGKAVVTGSIAAATFAGANGQNLDVLVDGLGPFSAVLQATAAIMTSENVQPFALADGMVVEWIVDGVPYTYAVAAVNYGGNPAAATAAQIVADPAIPAPLAAVLGLADVAGAVRATTVHQGSTATVKIGPNTDPGWIAALKFPVNGGKGTGNVANVLAYTMDELVAIMRSVSKLQFASAVVPDLNVPTDKALEMVSYQWGTGADITIAGTSSAPMLAALGLVAGSTPGTGHAVNGAAVTAAELFARLNLLANPPATVTNLGDRVKITGVSGIGKYHWLRFIGPLADALKIGGTKFGPGVDDDYADYRWVGEMAGLPLDQAPPNGGHLTWNDVSTPGLHGDITLTETEQARLTQEQNVNVFVLLSPSRGPEFADGRLSISFASGAPSYADQWVAVRWLALYLVRVFKANYDAVRDSNNQMGYASEADYTPYVITCVTQAEEVAVLSRCLAYVDATPPTAAKPTGVVITPKAKLSPTLKGLRIGEVKITAKLGSALHGILATITLNV